MWVLCAVCQISIATHGHQMYQIPDNDNYNCYKNHIFLIAVAMVRNV
jgi:hypothetical protein